MISALMGRSAKRLLSVSALAATALSATACGSFGTQRIGVPRSNAPLYHGAVLFNQRCSGCHTLSYAATHGSAANVRTAEFNNGPNFDQRCERPITRVLYAIQNGGFSGAIMPQNVVVGQDAIDVARFVATYSGRKAPTIPGQTTCQQRAIGTLEGLAQQAAGTASGSAESPAGTPTTAVTTKTVVAHAKAKRKP